jgi:rSAM/selenodomain-associated transferase 2
MHVSVIIPTLNEADTIGEAVRSTRLQSPREIIVVDGGSTDGTQAAAGAADIVLRTARGRAAQMNAGAAQARGEIVLFLHADCRLAPGGLAQAVALLSRHRVVAGCFTMRVGAEGRLYRLIDAAATARVRLTGLIYGDQGLFLRRIDFERFGGFPTVPFLEDVLFSKRLRAEGRIVVAPARIEVSPRRWQHVGPIRQTLRNWTLTALAAAGVSPQRLVRFYPAVRLLRRI